MISCQCLSQRSNKSFAWKNFSTEQGLPSPEVYTAIQDKTGYIWFGTDNGVSRFDGYTFKNYGAIDGLTDIVINSIQEDSLGRIWFCSAWGNLYIYENENIKPFPYNHIIQSFNSRFTFCLSFDVKAKSYTEGTILLGLNVLGILKIHFDGKYVTFTGNIKDSSASVIKFNTYKGCLLVQSNNRLINPLHWIHLFDFDGEDLIYERDFYNGKIGGNNFSFLKEGNKSVLCSNRILLHFDNEKEVFRRSGSISPITQIIKVDDYTYWAAELFNGGLNEYNSFEALGTNQKQPLIKNISASSIFKDRTGGVWVTSLEKGVFYLRDNSIEIFNQQNTAGFPSDWISALSADDDGNVYIGFWENEVGYLDKAKQYHRIDKDLGNVTDLQWYPQNKTLYYGSLSFLKRWNGNTIIGVKRRFYNNTFFNSLKKLSSRFTNQNNIYYIAAGGNNIGVIYGKEVYEKFGVSAKVGISTRSFSIYEDKQGNVWTGKLDGLYKIQGQDLVKVDTIHPALQCRIEDINELPDGTLVFGTKGQGIIIWDRHKAVQITSKEGLVSDMIEEVAIDKRGDIWLATLAGISHLHKNEQQHWSIEPITIYHGLPSNEVNSITFTELGTWVATTKGLALIHARKNIPACFVPKITNFTANGVTKTLSNTYSLLPNENNIMIEWNDFNYAQFGKTLYRYRLNASKEHWTYTNQRSIQLAAIASGKHQLEIQAQNESGNWSASLSIPFYVAPRWYATWYFRILVLGFIIGSFVVWNNKRIAKIKEDNKIQLKIIELERSALASQMNPHFIFNCLNSIQRLIQNNQKNDAMNYLSRFAKLVRTTLESTRIGRVNLESEVQMLENYLALEQLRFKTSFDYIIEVDDNVETFDTEIPPMLVQPFIENAIKYAWNDKTECAIIKVKYRQENEVLHIIIEDNGIGFENAHQKTFESTGLGIALTKQRLALHNEGKVAQDVHIVSNHNGTKVSLQIMV